MGQKKGIRTISPASGGATIVWDVVTDTCGVSPSLLDALGIDRRRGAGACLGEEFRKHVPVEELPRLFEVALAPNASLVGFDTVYPLLDRMGQAWPIRHTGHLMLDEAGRPRIVFGTVTPVEEASIATPADRAADLAIQIHELARANGWMSVMFATEIALLELVRLHQEAVGHLV